MKKNLNRICPICASESGDVLYTQGFIVPDEFPLAVSKQGIITQPIVSCSNCGFVFTDVEIFQKNYDDYYAKYGKYSCTLSQKLDLETANLNNYLINLVESICHSDKNKKIIDIGCGSGTLLADLKLKGFTKLNGIDTSPAIADLFEKSDIKCKTAAITEKNINLAKQELFDVVCLISVLEHVYDLETALTNISTMLEKNGLVIILVPDAASYYKELTNPIHQINLEHINHFDKISLDNLMKQYGFQPQIFDKYIMNTQTTSSTQLVSVYKKSQAATDGKKINFATAAAKSVNLLIEKWKKVEADNEMERLVSSREEVVVYGTGNYTYSMLSDSLLKKCHIVAFVDGNPNKQGTNLMKLPIYKPDFLLNYTGNIIISVAYEPQAIIQKITEMGLKNKIHII
jgi:SAM-dependent methyltransferase